MSHVRGEREHVLPYAVAIGSACLQRANGEGVPNVMNAGSPTARPRVQTNPRTRLRKTSTTVP